MSEEGTNIGYWQKVINEPPKAFKEWFEEEESYLLENISENDFVLDLGCGNGKNIETILRKTKKVTGVDNDPIATKKASETFKKRGDVKIILADASELPFQEDTFDVVTNLELIGNVGDLKQKIFQETHRVLKNTGILILSIYAETAFDERMKMYKSIDSPIEKIEGTTVYFDKSLGAHISEQFSLEQLQEFGEKENFVMVEHIKIGDLAYICKYKKK